MSWLLLPAPGDQRPLRGHGRACILFLLVACLLPSASGQGYGSNNSGPNGTEPNPSNPGGNGWSGPEWAQINWPLTNPFNQWRSDAAAYSLYGLFGNLSLTFNNPGWTFTYSNPTITGGATGGSSDVVEGIDLNLEYLGSDGNWHGAPVNAQQQNEDTATGTPISWQFSGAPPNAPGFPWGTTFRVLGYVYIYNPGKGTAGGWWDIASDSNTVLMPAYPTVNIAASSSNPGIGVSYTISATGTGATSGTTMTVTESDNGGSASTIFSGSGTTISGSPTITSATGTQLGTTSGPHLFTATVTDIYGNTVTASTIVTVPQPQPMTAPTSQAGTATYGQPWSPTIIGGTSGAGPYIWSVAGYTNFGTSTGSPTTSITPFTPTTTVTYANNSTSSTGGMPAGTLSGTTFTPASYTFYVGQLTGSSSYSGNDSDPNVGAMEINYTAYPLTVARASQPAVSSQNATITYGQSFTPTYFGGAGTGNWQFVISGYTNFSPGVGQPAGTNTPGIGWESSWTPPAAGTYTFYVANNGDSNYNTSNTAGPYTLTVIFTPPAISITAPSTGTVGNQISLSATATEGSWPLQTEILYYSWTGYGTGGTQLAATPTPSNPSCTIGNPFTPNQSGTLYLTATIADTKGNTSTAEVPVTISQAGQSAVTISPTSQTITAGNSITFTASGGSGTGAYTWGGTSGATGTGTTNTVSFPTVGTYTVTVYRAADTNYLQSNTATATVTVNSATPPTVSIVPASSTISAGQSITFTASGGLNGYVWGGSASGSGTSQTVTFPNVGNYTVTVYSPAGGNYTASNTATAAITVNAAGPGTVSIVPVSSTIYIGQSITFTASGGLNGYVWGGSASGSGTSQTVTFPNVGNYTVTVYSPAGGNYSVSNTATATITVNPDVPPAVSISPPISTIYPSQSITFTASGGLNGYVWGSSASGSGTTQTITFPSVGSYTVTVYSPAGGNYSVSNTATAMITVNLATPPTVYVAPASSTIYAGQSITFTASGGTNGYVWGGSASGSGTSQTVTFPSTGSYSVTVYSPAGGIYAVSNTATATITVNPPLVTASISANPTSGVAPASSTITWTSSNATSVSVSGTGLSSSNASGSQSVGPFSAGMYTYTITATGPGGSAAPTATFVVSAGFLTVSPSGTVQFPDAVRDTLALGPSNISGGAISSTKVFTLQNTGNAPLNITGIGLSGASSSCFTVQTQLTLPYALAPGASVQVTLVFTPGALGSAAPIGAVPNTTFSVTSDVNTPPPVTIFGICRAPKISITWHQ